MFRYISRFFLILLSFGYLVPVGSSAVSWIRTYSGLVGSSVVQTSEGGYIVVGAADASSDDLDSCRVYDTGILKTDSLGDSLWARIYHHYSGDDATHNAEEIHKTSDGGYIIIGWAWRQHHEEATPYLIKLDSLGDILWTKTYIGLNELTWSGQQTYDGGYIMCCWGVELIKTDSLGDIQWIKDYGGQAVSVRQTTDGGYIVLTTNIHLLKTDSLGDSLWTRDFGGDVSFGSVQQTSDGGYIIVGFCSAIDLMLTKTDSLGNPLWTRIYDIYGGSDWGFWVQQTYDGGYIVAGQTSGYDPYYFEQILLIKTDSLGLVGAEETPTQRTPFKFLIYPEPAGLSLTLKLSSLAKSQTDISLYDIAGRKVRELFSGRIDGEREIKFNLDRPASGIYFVRAKTGDGEITKRVTIIK